MSKPAPSPDRFRPSRRVLVVDRFMNRFIKVGGIGIIAAVLGMLVFIAAKVLPLFGSADVEPVAAGSADPTDAQPLVLSIDEWGELPFVFSSDGVFRFYGGEGAGSREHRLSATGGESAATVEAASYSVTTGTVLAALDSGVAVPAKLSYRKPLAESGGAGPVEVEVEEEEPIDLDLADADIRKIAFSESESARIIAVSAVVDGEPLVRVLSYKRKRSLLGVGELELDGNQDLTESLASAPEFLLVNGSGDTVVIGTSSGDILYFFRSGADGFALRQQFRPFEDGDIARIDYLLGDTSLSVASASGAHHIYSLFRASDDSLRLFGKTKEMADLGGRPEAFARSHRNRSFVVSADNKVSLRHSTTASVRWSGELEFAPVLLALNKKHTRIAAVGGDGRLAKLGLDDSHPEAGLRAFFGKIWYEDAPDAAFTWQSTGGSDEFEPKLSLMPLHIHGTLKGTLYAMLFAFPIALLAAIYTSQFLHPNVKAVVKPMMEIMASLPSVVLGFLGALWLAPRIETHTVSIALVVVFVPSCAFFLGWVWSRLPIGVRRVVRPGYEFAAFIPIIILGVAACWKLGPMLEPLLFSVTMPDGSVSHDFRDWWRSVTGLSFEPRNCVIIGIMMGFAVIPIIFTITEDALTSVPPGLRSASLALGASRWQTAWRVVLPTASAGIFSATMIGLGRAVGETMIVVMATGNTPIMEWNIFSGMRTLSANIAVELPEAPQNGTLYRTLFLGALVLFVMTFILNTLAEVLRQHLREKYKTV